MRARSILLVLLLASLPMSSALPAKGRSVWPALSPTPNRSIALYKAPRDGRPGRIWTGVVDDGVFVQKATFTTGRWSDIAVGRDTMALYDKRTGKLVTGTFKGGRFVKKASRTVARGYSHMAASCDSLALYKTATGQLLTAELTSGQFRDPRRGNIGQHLELMEASCDTIYLIGDSPFGINAMEVFGDLRFGFLGLTTTVIGAVFERTNAGANHTSFLNYNRTVGEGTWGALTDGNRVVVGSSGLSPWSHLVGVGDGLVFYLASSGEVVEWRLINGSIVDGSPVRTWRKGLTLIAGGR